MEGDMSHLHYDKNFFKNFTIILHKDTPEIEQPTGKSQETTGGLESENLYGNTWKDVQYANRTKASHIQIIHHWTLSHHKENQNHSRR